MRIVGQHSIAEAFGVTRETIDNWQREGFPVAVRGGPGVPSEYESKDCIAWLIARRVQRVKGDRQQDRLARVLADKIEMENERKRRQLIPVEMLEPRLASAYAFARETWREVVSRLARTLPADLQAREELLQTEMESFLHRLADWAQADVAVVDD